MKKILAATVLVFSIGACYADALIGDFTILNGAPSPSDGNVIFSLNPNGTISATLTLTGGDSIVGFGFDKGGVANAIESAFSPTTSAFSSSWSDSYLWQAGGFACLPVYCGASESWTIGNPGDFTSVFQTLVGNNSMYDFFVLNSSFQQWAANAVEFTVPEPATLFLMGLAFVGLGVIRRREQ